MDDLQFYKSLHRYFTRNVETSNALALLRAAESSSAEQVMAENNIANADLASDVASGPFVNANPVSASSHGLIDPQVHASLVDGGMLNDPQARASDLSFPGSTQGILDFDGQTYQL